MCSKLIPTCCGSSLSCRTKYLTTCGRWRWCSWDGRGVQLGLGLAAPHEQEWQLLWQHDSQGSCWDPPEYTCWLALSWGQVYLWMHDEGARRSQVNNIPSLSGDFGPQIWLFVRDLLDWWRQLHIFNFGFVWCWYQRGYHLAEGQSMSSHSQVIMVGESVHGGNSWKFPVPGRYSGALFFKTVVDRHQVCHELKPSSCLKQLSVYLGICLQDATKVWHLDNWLPCLMEIYCFIESCVK